MENLYRRTQILKLLRSDPEVTQDELRRKLARRGIQVTQATVSRDLEELGVVKTRSGYHLPEAVEPAAPVQPTLLMLKEFLREVSLASNLVLPSRPGVTRKRSGRPPIYTLGAILYQSLTGRPPFLGGSAIETLNLVVSTEVVAPRRLRPEVPRDLETICLKCLEKEPQKRYASTLVLGDDLRRFLEGRPIAARPVGSAERLWRWCRRDPWIAASVAILFLGTTISIWQAVRQTTAERTARSAAKAASSEAARAIRAEAETREQHNLAKSEAANAKAINEFRNDLLAHQRGQSGRAGKQARSRSQGEDGARSGRREDRRAIRQPAYPRSLDPPDDR